ATRAAMASTMTLLRPFSTDGVRLASENELTYDTSWRDVLSIGPLPEMRPASFLYPGPVFTFFQSPGTRVVGPAISCAAEAGSLRRLEDGASDANIAPAPAFIRSRRPTLGFGSEFFRGSRERRSSKSRWPEFIYALTHLSRCLKTFGWEC